MVYTLDHNHQSGNKLLKVELGTTDCMALLCNGARMSLSIKAMGIRLPNILITRRLKQSVSWKILTSFSVEAVQQSGGVVINLNSQAHKKVLPYTASLPCSIVGSFGIA